MGLSKALSSVVVVGFTLAVLTGVSCPPTYIYEFPNGEGEAPPAGQPVPGPSGPAGLPCWDLNGNGRGDTGEDVNEDGSFNALDCRGANGAVGATGIPCWDVNGNGQTDPDEDVNDDGNFDVLDCRGAPGAPGQSGQSGVPGLPGASGLSCWDLNGNGLPDSAEDIDGDGNCDADDCQARGDLLYWKLTGNADTVGGTNFLGTTDNQPLDLRVNGARALRVEPRAACPNLIGGFEGNAVSAGAGGAVIGGGGTTGLTNRVTDNYGTIGGGRNNRVGDNDDDPASSPYAVVGGGQGNIAGAWAAAVGGGDGNQASEIYATIGGGLNNVVSGSTGTVAGGQENQTYHSYGTIGGGANNIVGIKNSDPAEGGYATIPGGSDNEALADYSFAAGRQAKVRAPDFGSFIYADCDIHNWPFYSAAANEFAVRARGGFRLVTAVDDVTGIPTAGAILPHGDSSWSVLSDRAAKEQFAPVDGQEVLDRLATLSIETWNYRTQDRSIRHLGPMAQDFFAAFGLGEDNRHISTVDADGVALVAIQRLSQLLREKEERMQTQMDRIRALEQEVQAYRGRSQDAKTQTEIRLQALEVEVSRLAREAEKPQ